MSSLRLWVALLVLVGARPVCADETLAAGDLVKVLVLGQAELSGDFVVLRDGNLELPFVGLVPAAGASPTVLAERLRQRLVEGEILKQPQVDVRLIESQRRRVFVLGEVKKPGPFPLRGDITLRILLDAVGELSPEVGHEVVVIRPPATPGSEPAEARPEGRTRYPGEVLGAQVLHVALRELLAGQPEADLALVPGDTIYFPKAAQVYVVGHAARPGAFRFEEGLTVHRLLALAGGIGERGSNKLKLARLVDGKRKEVRTEPGELVLPEDTLVVPERFF